VTWEEVAAWRMRRQFLDERVPAERMLEVASRLCGLHAQLASSAELTLWARVEGLEPDAVSRALWEERTLYKSWAMRGTLHLLPAAERGLWNAALGTYDHYLKPAFFKGFGTSEEEVLGLIDAVSEALDGRELTREELASAVAERTGSAELGEKLAGSWGPLLKPAAFRGRLQFARSRGRNVCFTRPEAAEAMDPDEALREVARRFLAAYGPADRDDLARWFATTPAKAGKLLEAIGAEPVEVEGTPLFAPPGGLSDAAAAKPSRVVRLLPAFDQWVVGATRQIEHLLPAGVGRERVYRPQGWLTPVLLVDGRVAGLWRHERRGKRLAVSIESLEKLPAWARKGAEAEAESLASYLGGELSLRWEDV